MPTRQFVDDLYPKFGVKQYHDRNIQGQKVKLQVIDTGLSKYASRTNVIQRSMNGTGTSQNKHGSFVAHILAAPLNKKNALSCPGLVPEATIQLNDVESSNGNIYTSYLVAAINDAIDLGVDILSISLGTHEWDSSMELAVTRASEAGILVFAAAGNSNKRLYEFPAACEDAISVASMDHSRKLSAFNTRNDNVSIFAPGESLQVDGSKVSGTSFATPFAAGLAALVLSNLRFLQNDPKARMSKDQMIGILRNSDHLSLSCEHHNYTRANGCSVRGISDAKVPNMDALFNMTIKSASWAESAMWNTLAFLLIVCLLIAIGSVLRRELMVQQSQQVLSHVSGLKYQ